MKSIKSIEFVFENCETIKIDDIFNIGSLTMLDIHDKIETAGWNCIAKFTVANEIYIELLKKADKEYYPFDDKTDFEEYKTTIFKRISQYNDITGVTVRYDNDIVEDYSVFYDEEGDYLGAPNVRQEVKMSDNGNLYIVISKKGLKVIDIFEEYFDEEIKQICVKEIKKEETNE